MKAVCFLNYRAGSGMFQTLCGCPPWFMTDSPPVPGVEPSGFLPSLPPIRCEHIDCGHLQERIDTLSFLFGSFFIVTHIGDWWGDLRSDQVPLPYESPSPMKWSLKELEKLSSVDQFFYLVRDGRGQIDSLRYLKGGVEEQHQTTDPGDYFRVLALGYRNRMRMVLDARKEMGTKMKILKMEELVTFPMSTMVNILQTLKASTDYNELRGRVEVLSIGETHSSFKDGWKPHRWDRWKEWERQFLMKVAGREMEELGYV